MGLFGGSKSKSVSNVTNTDASSNLADSKILGDGAVDIGLGGSYRVADKGGILADEVNQTTTTSQSNVGNTTTRNESVIKSNADNISISGEGVTFQGFSDNVAGVVSKAVEQLGNVSNNIGAALLTKATGQSEPKTESKITPIVGGLALGGSLFGVAVLISKMIGKKGR